MGGIGGPELILVFIVVLLVFGPKKIPEIARAMGKGMREFRRLSVEFQREINIADALEGKDAAPPAKAAPAKTPPAKAAPAPANTAPPNTVPSAPKGDTVPKGDAPKGDAPKGDAAPKSDPAPRNDPGAPRDPETG
ncbi:MAG: hypothetical protein DHS20C21_16210 [Gemmatimonadota bacterium]|nr:MAG: hypothetical protein DHS20C21_16210 [Gemmatimonadota bacterium]